MERFFGTTWGWRPWLFLLLAVLCLAAIPAAAQTTVVRGAITDANGTPYSNGTISASLSPPGVSTPHIGAWQIQAGYGPFQLDSKGNFAMALPDNNQILPAGTQWQFTVNHPGVAPPLGTGPQTCSATVTITGASQVISSSFSCPAIASISSATALKPAASDAVQFVTTGGSDSNDGLSWGTAKLTLGAAYLALPACAEFGNSYAHCGRINIGAGTFTVSSQINIASPLVDIWGASASSTQLSWTGTTGCAIAWTSTPFNAYGPQESLTHGLHNLAIVNNGGSAGTCGLETFDIIGFNSSGLVISGFNGAGSSGWWDNAVAHFNEQFNVEMHLSNCATDWLVTNNNTVSATFGYGIFNIWADGLVAGAVGIQFDGKTAGLNFSHNQIHWIVELGDATHAITQIGIKNSTTADNNVGVIRMESSGAGQTGVSVDATSKFDGNFISTETGSTDSIAAGGLFSPVNDATYGNIYKDKTLPRRTVFGTTNGNQVDFVWHALTSTGTTNEILCGLGITGDNRFECKDNINLASFWRYNIGATAAASTHTWFLAGTTAATLNTTGLLLGNGETYLFNPTSSAFTATITQATPSANQTYTLPATGGTFSMALTGSVAGSITALAANSCGDAVTATITGATTSMVATASPQAAISAGLVLSTPFVSAANTVTVGYCNVTTASITPAAATFNIRVIQ